MFRSWGAAAAKIAKTAHHNGTTLREEAIKLAPPLKNGSGTLTAEKFDQSRGRRR